MNFYIDEMEDEISAGISSVALIKMMLSTGIHEITMEMTESEAEEVSKYRIMAEQTDDGGMIISIIDAAAAMLEAKQNVESH